MGKYQNLRISHMVLTLGPGAILESREGPRVILRDGLQLPPDVALEDLKLSSPELEVLLLRLLGTCGRTSIHIYQVPGAGAIRNAFWRTKPFPEWHLCVTHQILYRSRCPECEKERRPLWQRRREAIRFVLACPSGHLDDVNWDMLVHGESPPHRSDHYHWESRGTGLSDIYIVCPRCGGRRSLGEAYGKSWPCSGRFPEREGPGQRPHRPGCTQRAYILQRQASSLRVPETVSLFTVPPLFTAVHQVMRKLVQQLTPDVAREFLLSRDGSLRRENLGKTLDSLVKEKVLRVSEQEEVLSCPDQVIIRAIQDVLDYSPPSDFASLLSQEFRAFLHGAREGIPPLRDSVFPSRVLLEINPRMARQFPPFLVVPVSRLRLVTVQIGYRRQVGPVLGQGRLPDLVDISIQDRAGNRWFPGYESTGEGLFITLADTEEKGWVRPFPGATAGGKSERWGKWMRAYQHPDAYDGGLFRDPHQRIELHPCFVAWHTFSHLLIRALSVDSGYSAPSIRERVYLEEAPDGRVRGGVLIYTTSRGGDGSLGGLLVLANTFDRILDRIREMARFCSADPLCQEHDFEPGREVLGAACHACCLVSETSCEHRNHWLDRIVLMETGWFGVEP